MFLGHYALGFGAKKLTPYTSLGTLLLAAEFVDLLWPSFLMLGIETVRIAPGITRVTPLDFTSYPWTHSLVMGAVWAGLRFTSSCINCCQSSPSTTVRTGRVMKETRRP